MLQHDQLVLVQLQIRISIDRPPQLPGRSRSPPATTIPRLVLHTFSSANYKEDNTAPSFLIDFYSMSLKILAWFSTIAHCVSGSLQFLSRPDLSPPKLNITTPASSDTETGYLFITAAIGDIPGSIGPDQPGAYIFQDDGELVWSGVGYFAGWVANFGPVMIDGKPALRAFQGDVIAATGRMLGNHAILDNSYRTMNIVQADSHRLSSAHEFEMVDDSSVLIETPIMTIADLGLYGGDQDQRFLLEGGFQG